MLPIPPTVNCALLGTPFGVGVGGSAVGTAADGVDGAVCSVGGAADGVGGATCRVGGALHFSLSTQVLQ